MQHDAHVQAFHKFTWRQWLRSIGALRPDLM